MTLAPTAQETRATLGHVFPSLLGIKLSRRMNEDTFHEIIKKVKAAQDMDDARRTAAVAHLVDQLKANFDKQYDIQFDDNRRRPDATFERSAITQPAVPQGNGKE
jgi:hypothetical protein